jgi:hypothetical protein
MGHSPGADSSWLDILPRVIEITWRGIILTLVPSPYSLLEYLLDRLLLLLSEALTSKSLGSPSVEPIMIIDYD